MPPLFALLPAVLSASTAFVAPQAAPAPAAAPAPQFEFKDGDNVCLLGSALAERLQYLADHPETWLRMGRAGRKHVEQNYNCNLLSHQLVEIYRRVIEQYRPSTSG